MWQDVVDGSEGEHDQAEGCVCGVKSVGAVDDEPDASVEAFVPVVFGIVAVQFGAAVLPEDGGVTDTIMDAIKSFAPIPIYLRLGMSPVVLTAVACLANGVLNIVPWGGPTVRAATVLKVSRTTCSSRWCPA